MATLHRLSFSLALLAMLAPPGLRAQDIFADGFEPAARVVINEIDTNDLAVGDWVELYNAGEVGADMTGWSMTDNDPTHVYSFPAFILAPGAYLVLDRNAVGSFTFGLGSGDSLILYNASLSVVDAYTWVEDPAETYRRCPNGTGAFINIALGGTKGSANACP